MQNHIGAGEFLFISSDESDPVYSVIQMNHTCPFQNLVMEGFTAIVGTRVTIILLPLVGTNYF